MSVRALVIALGVILSCAPAAADERVVLRWATVAPEGSAWAREGQAFAREVEQLTEGRVKIKLYWGGITGDELQTLEQVRRGRIDAIASGGMSCLRMAPSLRVFRIPGLFRDRGEAAYVNNRLQSTIDAEFLRAGYINLGELSIGPEMLFTRDPVRSMSDLERIKVWFWDLDPVLAALLPAMGLSTISGPISEALRLFENGGSQAIVAVPTAALAFQWSAQSRYLVDLTVGMLRGCLVVTTHAYDALRSEDQHALRVAGAKAALRLEEVGRESDEALLHGLFVRQGLTLVKPSEAFRSEFLAAAMAARDQMPDSIVPRALVLKVLTLLADYRGIHQ
ncbi:MAG TPA: TRAP transporter substrate-binding protein DctP [Polyangia bacterium]